MRHTADSEFLSGEKTPHALQRELGHVPLDNLLATKILADFFFRVTTNLVENVVGKPGRFAVLVSNALDCNYGIVLIATGEQELGRFIKMEKEEAAQEHTKGNSAYCEYQIPPAHVILFSARPAARAAEVGNESPGQET